MPKFKVYARETIICEYMVNANSMEDAEVGEFSSVQYFKPDVGSYNSFHLVGL